jgi:hypothetical protein
MKKIQGVGHHSSFIIGHRHLSHLPREHAIRNDDTRREADDRRQPVTGDFILRNVREELKHAVFLILCVKCTFTR